MTTLLVAILLVLFGLVIGSFLNVVIHRLPREDTKISSGRSQCPSCHTQISARDNIPVVSWLALRGRCRHCGWRIPVRYPLVELSVPVLWLTMLWTWGAELRLVPFLWLVPVLVSASVIDMQTMKIPKKIVWPGFVVGLILISVVSLWPDELTSVPELFLSWGDTTRDLILHAVLGAAMYFGFLFIAWFAYPKGMGFGDVRLALVLGLYLGWIDLRLPLLGLIISSFLGAVGGVIILLAQRSEAPAAAEPAAGDTATTVEPTAEPTTEPGEAGADPGNDGEAGDEPTRLTKTAFPFGPWLALGTFVAIWFHHPLVCLLDRGC